MGKVIAAIVVIAILVLGYVFLFDTDVETTGEFDTPEIDVEGEFDAPETDVDIEAPDVGIEEEVITVPQLDIDPADEGEAEATDDELEEGPQR